MYIWIVTVGAVCLVAAWIYYKLSASQVVISTHTETHSLPLLILSQLQEWWSVFRGTQAINSFGNDLAAIRHLCASWTALVLCVLLPLYSVFHVYFSTHEYTYGWFVSLSYVGGVTPAMIALSVLICVLLLVEMNVQKIGRHLVAMGNVMSKIVKNRNDSVLNTTETDATVSNTSHGRQFSVEESSPLRNAFSVSSSSTTWQHMVQWILMALAVIVANIAIVLAVNAAYVYSTTIALGSHLLQLSSRLYRVWSW